LLKHDRAIVTEIPGTTRDVIEGLLSLGGLPVLLADTAGIREPGDALEQEGVRRTKNSIAEADLVLFVLDSSGEFDAQDSGIASDLGSSPVLGVLNKSDLPSRLSPEEVKERTAVSSLVSTSALQGTGLEGLKAKIAELLSGASRKADGVLVTNLRHAQALNRTKEALSRSEQALNQNLSEEFIALELREALSALGELTGETTNEEVLSRIFSQFCIGK
jgi:tRNA modification GTPase